MKAPSSIIKFYCFASVFRLSCLASVGTSSLFPLVYSLLAFVMGSAMLCYGAKSQHHNFMGLLATLWIPEKKCCFLLVYFSYKSDCVHFVSVKLIKVANCIVCCPWSTSDCSNINSGTAYSLNFDLSKAILLCICDYFAVLEV